MSLKEYVKKRDFKKTAEPHGHGKAKTKKKISKAKTTNLMFVVQEHHASHLHYDFRLEWEGVLKSWAVPKGPSLDPAVKRLAVEVEDHPVKYGKFEGSIPKGQYGGGEVYIWDTGTWTPTMDAVKGFKKGHLEFELKGKKLKGKWHLVRTRMQGSKYQWLLMKSHDQYVSDKPLKPVVAAKAAGKAKTKKTTKKIKEEIEFVEPQLAQLVTDAPEGKNWIHEVKFDGYRMQSHIADGDVKIFTRSGLDWTDKFPKMAASLKKLKTDQAVIDGEIVVVDDEGRTDFQELQNAIKSKDHSRMVYYAFDLLYHDGQDLRDEPLLKRKALLKKILPKGAGAIRFSEHQVGLGDKLFANACDLKLEGIISKEADAVYSSGRRDAWRKVKCGLQQEFVIGGYSEGQGSRHQGIGALLLGVYDGDSLRYVGKVGTGFTQQSLKDLQKVFKSLKQEKSPFDVGSPKAKGLHWLKPTKSAEITFANWTADKHLRVPVFHGLREDKPTKEIHIEKPQARGKIKKAGKKSMKKATVTKSDSELPLTHPEKIIFAGEKITKLQVAQFYLKIADHIMPHLSERPLSLMRCPSGAGKACFFQKHIHGEPGKNLKEVEIEEKSGVKEYIMIDQPEALVDLVQMSAFEIHAWNTRKDHLEQPDQIVMDFDPGPGVSWKQVVQGALDLKKILDQLKIKSFVKVSGSKGLHVHIPFAPRYGWDDVKEFAHSLAKTMEQQSPDLYVSKMTKSLRKGRIFVDYLRNGRGATAVAPYSLRARADSAVALPVEWKDLGKIKSANQFTLPVTLKLLAKRKKDPWADYFKKPQRIEILEGRGKRLGSGKK